MCECKNCGIEIKNNRIYCSLTCRNIYVNKNLRDYSKLKETNKIKLAEQKKLYNINPKRCKFCNEIIIFEDKIKKFCNSSCSAKFNNKFNKGSKHNISDETKKILIKIANENFSGPKKDKYEKDKLEYYKEPNKCLNCDKNLEFIFRNRVFCNNKCRKEYYLKNKEDFEIYYQLSKFKFSLNLYKDEFSFDLIEKYGWYKAKNNGDNVDGVSRDHMLSVKEGFRQLINPLLIAHPANCELVINKQNQSKNDKCSLTIYELLEKIKIFELKYGSYYKNNIKSYINLNELKEIYLTFKEMQL